MTLVVDPQALLSCFPPVKYGMAYGSGVFQQAGGVSTAPPMLDFVFAVDDPESWHAENLQRNREHYPWVAVAAGAGAIARVQDSFGARVWYNALVPVPPVALAARRDVSARSVVAPAKAVVAAAPPQPHLMKYGVISTSALLEDLSHWTTLYIAGRMHKPVYSLTPGTLLPCRQGNLRAALCAALLLLPSHFTPVQLYAAITGLSYTGDWRMVFGEDPHKVRNIVLGSLPAFQALYAPLLQQEPFASMVSSSSSSSSSSLDMSCDDSPGARVALGMGLPLAVQRRMAGYSSSSSSSSSSGSRGGLRAALASLLSAPSRGTPSYTAFKETAVAGLWGRSMEAGSLLPRDSLRSALVGIVAPSARGQSIKGILTAGPVKSAAYAAAKIVKSFRGFLRG
jgi:translocator assembly and maintenance protein 41